MWTVPVNKCPAVVAYNQQITTTSAASAVCKEHSATQLGSVFLPVGLDV